MRQPQPAFYVLLGAGLLVFIETFALLSPILLSLLLILLITFAVNPVIPLLRRWTGGRKGATGLLAAVLIGVIGLTGWALFVPMKASLTRMSKRLPAYWELVQKPLIKLEQQAIRSEDKLRAEVTNEIARTAPVAAPGKASPPAPEAVAAKPAKESGSISSGLGQTLQSVAGIFSMLVCVAAFGVLGALIAAPVAAIVDILHDVLYRKRYLPSVTDGDLARLAGKALGEKVSEEN